jgi:hypothetical protein
MHARRRPKLVPLLGLTGLTALAGLAGSCRSAYYGLWEKLGVEKREIMVDRVEDAREAQSDAKDQFVSALDRFRTVVEIEPSELESVYEDLADELESSEERASAVQSRVASVEEVAADLFEEWEAELDEYKDPDLARSSAELLEKTRDQYDGLITAMRKASDSMTPVLETFRDQVRFLKHNLNAEAIASLQGELGSIESSTAALVRDMEAAIAEADAFIAGMRKEG